ncbi:MAG: GNAT family N-acetyltransferase [Pseudolabrys sp.]|nr:GNAT family N-acetyltransferase [Pseudolabrys sp.]
MTKPADTEKGLAAPVPLSPEHDLANFNSGREELDVWLKTRALDSEGTTARTYVVCEKETTVVGYYCLSTGSVERAALPSKMKRRQGLPNQVPVLILGRLARDVNYKGRGLGGDLLQDALQRVLAASQIVGIRALLVHALDDEAASFWRHYGFIESPIGSRTFFLPIETIADALG